MGPWPTMVSKVTWWPDIIDFILFGFLDPENHILDTLITSSALIHTEIILIDHLGHVKAMWPWPTMVSKVTWWPDIINFFLFGFLDPENHILDTLITFVALLHPGIMLIDHFAMWPWPTMVSKVTWWSDIIDFILFVFFDPENHILDTEITSLSFIDPEIIKHICVGSHLGRHLEFWTPATGERHSPPIFENCTSIRRKWD